MQRAYLPSLPSGRKERLGGRTVWHALVPGFRAGDVRGGEPRPPAGPLDAGGARPPRSAPRPGHRSLRRPPYGAGNGPRSSGRTPGVPRHCIFLGTFGCGPQSNPSRRSGNAQRCLGPAHAGAGPLDLVARRTPLHARDLPGVGRLGAGPQDRDRARDASRLHAREPGGRDPRARLDGGHGLQGQPPGGRRDGLPRRRRPDRGRDRDPFREGQGAGGGPSRHRDDRRVDERAERPQDDRPGSRPRPRVEGGGSRHPRPRARSLRPPSRFSSVGASSCTRKPPLLSRREPGGTSTVFLRASPVPRTTKTVS